MTIGESSVSRVWIAAAAVAGLGTWIMFDAVPGINWFLWVLAATAGLILLVRADNDRRKPVLIIGAIAVVIAGGTIVTADPFMNFITFVSVLVLLAIAMLLSAGGTMRRVTAGFTIAAPIVALTNAFISGLSRASEATQLVGSGRARAAVRGLAITIPVVVVFALLLAAADPVFALWRDTIGDIFTDWEFLPRVIFFVALFAFLIGVYGYAESRTTANDAAPTGTPSRKWLGAAERLILLGGVTGLLWLFMAVQLSYLFGNLPTIPGSGVTFAEYARRGFGEMTIVASASTLLIIASERYGERNGRANAIRALTFALIIAVLFLLGSAFNRVMLYEAAYGFTTARLYAQAFMLVVAAGLIALSIEVMRELDPGRLFRRIAVPALVVLVVLVYWNHQAWIARLNIDRYKVTGKLDTSYLVRELWLNAVPAVVDGLAALPEPARSELRGALERQYQGKHGQFDTKWFEWNRGRARARAALESAGIDLMTPRVEQPAVTPTT